MTRIASYPNPLLRSWRLSGGAVQQPNLWYRLLRPVCQVTFTAIWQVRVFNRHYEPADGGVVYISNHQSFLDPMLVSMALRRPMNYMARDSLFRFPLFRQLITSLNAFPVRRGTADLAALKEAMRRIKGVARRDAPRLGARAGGQVAVFAEATRTRDGRIGPMLPGVAVLSQRAADWTVPVVIDGAFEAWPRTSALPLPGSIAVQFAPPISQAQARAMAPEQFVEHVRRILIDMQADLRRRTGRPPLRYD